MNPTSPFKRQLLKLAGLGPALAWTRLLGAANDGQPFRIAFGSCLHQDKEQPIWDAVLANAPDLFIFLGDNIYGDSDDPRVLAAKYDQLAGKPGFRRLRESTAIMAIWDDHDYGRNDAGRDYPAREASRRLMLDFWREPQDSPRRSRPDGIYTSATFRAGNRDIQVILPDLRWNRSRIDSVPAEADRRERKKANMGPYLRNDDANAVLLGESQWQWLQATLEEPCDLRLIGSSIQLLADFTGWEAWSNFSHERERLFRLLARHQDVPTVIISGDVHWCELSRYQPPGFDAPLTELTSSGLTEVWELISPNRHRVGEAFALQNFGLIECDWSRTVPAINLSVRDVNNRAVIEHTLPVAASIL